MSGKRRARRDWRGVAYAKYVNERYGARHTMVIVPACGHNTRCMFTDNAALPLIFSRDGR
jgi:hypothetical protein